MLYFKRNTDNEKTVWHKWFAWFPVTVQITPDGDYKKIWFEYVARCGTVSFTMSGAYWNWKYKPKSHLKTSTNDPAQTPDSVES